MLAPADNLGLGARSLAFVASALVVLIGGLALWHLYTAHNHRCRLRVLDRNRIELERLRSEDGATLAGAQINAARLHTLLEHNDDGIALFDSSLRLLQWNHPFVRGIAVEPRPDMPLDTLLRDQVKKGMFGDVSHVEVEGACRTGLLQSGDANGLAQPGPNHEQLILRGLPIAEDGCMLLLNELPAVTLRCRPRCSLTRNTADGHRDPGIDRVGVTRTADLQQPSSVPDQKFAIPGEAVTPDTGALFSVACSPPASAA